MRIAEVGAERLAEEGVHHRDATAADAGSEFRSGTSLSAVPAVNGRAASNDAVLKKVRWITRVLFGDTYHGTSGVDLIV